MKKNKKLIIIISLVIVLLGLVIIFFNLSKTPERKQSNQNFSLDKAVASIKTIENTLSSSGQVSSGLTENHYLHTGYYFEEMLVSENILIKEGTNIIKYTNGTYMVAPYDCVIISNSLPKEGEICTSNHYIQISSIETLCMNLSVSETDINKIEVGDSVDITMTASGETLEGFITSVSEVGNYSSSGSYFTAVVTFENNGNQKIGMSATCEIIIESAKDVVAVPVESIQSSDESKYVIVINDDGTTSNVKVETGISSDAYTEIKSGITENTVVQIVKASESSSNSFGERMNGRGGNFEGFPDNMPGNMQFEGGRSSMPKGEMTKMP